VPPTGYEAPPPGPSGYNPPPGPPSYYAPPAAPPKRNRRGLVIAGALVVIVLLVIGGVFLFRDRLSGDVTDLQVGDCFDEPASGTTSVTDVQHQPCTAAHDAEIIYIVADTSTSYPSVSYFDTVANQVCTDQATAYIGTDFNTRADINGGYFYPTSDSWDGGNKNITCYIDGPEGTKLYGSLKNIGTAPLPTPH
jgi:hypothetical protein